MSKKIAWVLRLTAVLLLASSLVWFVPWEVILVVSAWLFIEATVLLARCLSR